MTEAALSQQQK